MTKLGSEMDASDFLGKFDTIVSKEIPIELAQKGMTRAGYQHLRDTVMETPTTPHKEGFLRGSGSVHTQGKFQGSSGYLNTAANVKRKDPSEIVIVGESSPNKEELQAPQKGMIETIVGYNMPYAAHLHEHPEYNFTEEGAGGKYMESKLLPFKDDYFALVAETIKEGGG